MSLITTPKGDSLLAFHPGDVLDIPETERAIPLPLALVAAWHQGKTLFIFNQWRNVWELPGGMIEQGETPHEAAARELKEESGQSVANLRYAGWMKFRLKPDDRLELGVLYVGELDTIQPFEANAESAKIMLWDMASPIDGDVSAIDLYLARIVTDKR